MLYQALLGLLLFAITLFMLAGYRRPGAWGRSEALPAAVDCPRGHRLSCPLSLERVEGVEGVVSEVHYQHPALGEPTWKFLDRETVGVSVGQEV